MNAIPLGGLLTKARVISAIPATGNSLPSWVRPLYGVAAVSLFLATIVFLVQGQAHACDGYWSGTPPGLVTRPPPARPLPLHPDPCRSATIYFSTAAVFFLLGVGVSAALFLHVRNARRGAA
ncbi:MAG: hypothetical protein AMXMBFR58_39020 [Phycisphaerae bacterium]